jgi:hypothetical protein
MNCILKNLFRFSLATCFIGAASVPITSLAGDRTLFIGSAVENADGTATFPLYRGTSHGKDVWYILLDSSDGKTADTYRINRSQKLNNTRGTTAVQKVSIINGVIDFPATVNFAGARTVIPDPITGFPPQVALPGPIGETSYSPLIQLPNGVILNAPHIANGTGKAPKALVVDTVNRKVRFQQTDGFQGGKAVKYVSTDSSSPIAAALENVTFAPALDAAPAVGNDGTDSSRAGLVAFINGQTGAANSQRQGLNSALLDGLDPLNVLAWSPNQGRYSPLWDVHLAQWSNKNVADKTNLRQKDFGTIENLAHDAIITSPGGAPFAAAGFIVNCPIVSRD